MKPHRVYTLFRNLIRANGGGIRLMFDPKTETLRGSYSSN